MPNPAASSPAIPAGLAEPPAEDQPEPAWAASFLAAGRRAADRALLRAHFTKPWPEPLLVQPARLKRLAAQEAVLGLTLGEPSVKARAASLYARPLGGQAAARPDLSGELWENAPSGKRPPGLGPPAGDDERAVLDFWGRTMALAHGAALVGVAPLREDFFYRWTVGADGRAREILFQDQLPEAGDGATAGPALIIPRQRSRVLILAFWLEPRLLTLNEPPGDRISPKPALSYDQQADQTLKVARYLRRSGYLALPSDGGLMILPPMGVLAGLGQAGRHGLLIAPEYGPNLRLFAIVTDWPFELDQAVDFGAPGYCDQCRKCLDGCPAKAIPAGGPTWSAVEAWGSGAARAAGNQPGGRKWYVNQTACFDYWLKTGQPCQICLEVCPYLTEPLWCGPGPVSLAQRRDWADLLLTPDFEGPFITRDVNIQGAKPFYEPTANQSRCRRRPAASF